MDSNAEFTSDLVTSDAGKLFKTIYMMAATYEDNLPKKVKRSNNLTTSLIILSQTSKTLFME